MNTALYILTKPIPEGSVGVFWIGQAGFVFKTHSGRLIAVDPYLSDNVGRTGSFKRIVPSILGCEEIIFDYIISTHEHEDHLDPDAIPLLMTNNVTRLIAAKQAADDAHSKLGVPTGRIVPLTPGDSFSDAEFTVTALPCDHGTASPTAIGLLLEFGSKRVYISGDTCPRPDTFSDERIHGCELAIFPINGAFGNLNEREAAEAAQIVGAKLTVPSHFWCFAEHGGNPARFAEAMDEYPDSPAYYVMAHGEAILI